MLIGYADAEQEIITRTAWKKGLADKRNVFLNYNHNSDLILAATKSGTMTLEDKEDGLHFKANLPDTDIGNRAFQTIKRGDVNTLSFEFVPFDWEVKDNTVYLRSGRLEAISVCASSPAYTSTECHTTRNLKEQIRKLTRTIKQKRNTEEMDKETIDELKNLLTQILEALPKEERKETEKEEKETDKKEETPQQSSDIEAEETDKSEEKKSEAEVLEKLKQLDELKKELEKTQGK